MATALQIDEPQTAGTDIAVAVAQNPGIVLLDTAKFDVFYEKLRADAPTDADVSTRKGQEALRSFAAKVRSEKAGIDKARLRLTAEWRDMTAQANAAGKIIAERLETLAVEVRAPLTAWEEAEKARIAHCRAIIDGLNAMARIDIDDTASVVRERGRNAWLTKIDPEQFGDMADEAQAAKDAAVSGLKTALARLEREEAERAELARLRAENEAREAREREERDARERLERETEEARRAEQRRIDAEKAEQERIARVEHEAAERAKRAAEEAAEAERQRVKREHDEALAAEEQRRQDAERAAQALRDEIEAAEQARKDALAAEAAEQAKRDKDRAHRSAVMKASKEAIMTCGTDDDTAKKIVLLIRAGEVPNVTLRF